jgi:uncharacterized protein YhdP
MRKYLVALGMSIALGSISNSANAATFLLNVDSPIDSLTFGNTSTKKGSFSDVFNFTVTKGVISTFVGSIALLPSLDVTLKNVTFDGVPISKISTGKQELWSLDDTQITAGKHSIGVSGTWGTKGGSYSGTLNYAAVPEPAAWAMMIAGFGFVGASMRRRRTMTVRYA